MRNFFSGLLGIAALLSGVWTFFLLTNCRGCAVEGWVVLALSALLTAGLTWAAVRLYQPTSPPE